MHKALLPAALVALLGVIVAAPPRSAQSVQAEPPGLAPPVQAPRGQMEGMEGMAPAEPAPARVRWPSARARRARIAARPVSPVHRRRRVVHAPLQAPPDQQKAAERNGYKRLSDLVNFPKFFPGLGIVFVKPDTIPLGPFLCFDRNDHLIATVYMVSTKDIDDHKSFEAPAFAGKVDHISYYFNPGHPGFDVPHYHIVIWHVSKEEEARAAH